MWRRRGAAAPRRYRIGRDREPWLDGLWPCKCDVCRSRRRGGQTEERRWVGPDAERRLRQADAGSARPAQRHDGEDRYDRQRCLVGEGFRGAVQPGHLSGWSARHRLGDVFGDDGPGER